ncbi:hypothetical protein AVEN_160563-1 [Araneus ventricosus]|uniref:Uncharacterized protein n=1 Tax=Araneus ventricosus TaxID=182803 RepID=A0A4Y2LD79_ARAVE|nr:hypothetical protein AVEN_160563-1 [Araneus ventricosus]
MESPGEIRISVPNRDNEKNIAFSEIFNLLPKMPNLSRGSLPRSGVQAWPLPDIPYLPLQNSLPNHKTNIAGKRHSMFVAMRSGRFPAERLSSKS